MDTGMGGYRFDAVCAVLILLWTGCATTPPTPSAQPAAGRHSVESLATGAPEESMQYWLYLPADYQKSSRAWPLLVFLHGLRERGDNAALLNVHGPGRAVVEDGRDYPFLIVAPQCPEGHSWSDAQQIGNVGILLRHLEARYRIDRDRVYITGLSMGGNGAWRVAAAYPGRFAALAPIGCWGIVPPEHVLENTAIRMYYGLFDPATPAYRAGWLAHKIRSRGGSVEVKIFPCGHEIAPLAYTDDLYNWLLQQRRSTKGSSPAVAERSNPEKGG